MILKWFLSTRSVHIKLVSKFRNQIVALVPEARGSGLGTRLLRALQAEAAEKGLPLRLKVVLTNPARRLYQRLGFVGLGDDGVYEQMEWRSDFGKSKSESDS